MNADNISKHIGQVCQQYRIKNNLTQNQVAELTGLEPKIKFYMGVKGKTEEEAEQELKELTKVMEEQAKM